MGEGGEFCFGGRTGYRLFPSWKNIGGSYRIITGGKVSFRVYANLLREASCKRGQLTLPGRTYRKRTSTFLFSGRNLMTLRYYEREENSFINVNSLSLLKDLIPGNEKICR